MQLSSQQIECFADLSQKIKKAKARIDEIKQAMGQLTLDSCTSLVKVHLHNGTIHSKNQALAIAAQSGSSEAAAQMKNCQTNLSFCLTESTMLRMLQVLLTEQESVLAELQLEAEAHYTNSFTPTLALHEA